MAQLMQAALKNPQAFGAVVGAVVGLIIGLVIDLVFFHHYARGLVIGLVIGAALGFWQYKMITARATKFLLGRALPR